MASNDTSCATWQAVTQRVTFTICLCGVFSFSDFMVEPFTHAVENADDRVEDSESTVDREADFIAHRNRRIEKLRPAPIPPAIVPHVVHPIDRFIISAWPMEDGARPPSKLCDVPTFARRVYLDVIGVIPTVDELSEFLQSSLPNKRELLIDELLTRDADYAAHYTSWWEDALASSKSDTFGGVLTRGDYQSWVFDNLKQNAPYDLMVAELIDPTLPGYKKPNVTEILGVKFNVAFLRDRSHKEILQSASDVAQVFLGTGMKCASCHDHFENPEWPQDRFLSFAGFFSPRDLEIIRCEEPLGDFAETRWPFEHDLGTIGVPEQHSDRLALAARLLTDPLNRRFSETIVNRLWKRYLGTALYEPVDDFRTDQPASHPELLAWLANDLVRHRFDIRHTIRQILTSETYQQAYRAELADQFDLDARAAPRYYRSPSLRRLTAEQLIDSVEIAATQRHDHHRRVFRTLPGRPSSLAQSLGRPVTRSEVSTFRSGEAAIVPALELLNGSTYHRLTRFCVHLPLTKATPLSDLTGAQRAGVRVAAIRIHADGITQDVDLLGVATLGDVTTRVNQALQQVKVPPDNQVPGQLELIEDSFYLQVNPGHSISIEDVGDGEVAADLGIYLQATSSSITGENLGSKPLSSDEQSPRTALLTLYLEQADAVQLAEHLYQLTLSRPASDEEIAYVAEYLQANGYGDGSEFNSNTSSELIVDIFWALVTSPMFQYIY